MRLFKEEDDSNFVSLHLTWDEVYDHVCDGDGVCLTLPEYVIDHLRQSIDETEL